MFSCVHLWVQSFSYPSGYDNSEFAEQAGGFVERKAHHCGVASLQPLHKRPGAALYSIGARLVEWLARIDVRGDARGVERLEGHPRLPPGEPTTLLEAHPPAGEHPTLRAR